MVTNAKRTQASSGSGKDLPEAPQYRVEEKTVPYGQAPADARGAGAWRDFREVYRSTPVERIDLIRKGVSAADFKRFVGGLDVQQEKIFGMLDIATATVNRKASRNEPLSQEDSEKVLGMAKLIGQVETILDESGDPDAAPGFDAARWLIRWMDEPVPALGGAAPAEYMDTIEGHAMIARLLALMQSGAYA